MILELFENTSILISDIESDKKFKVNAYRLKPYLTLEPLTPKGKGESAYSRGTRGHDINIILTQSVFVNFIWFHVAEEVKLSAS